MATDESTGIRRAGLPKAVLRAVAMMHVPIDDQHPLEPQGLCGNCRGHGHVVEQAEAHGRVCQCVMSWRADQAQGIAGFSRHDASHGVYGGAGRQSGDIIAIMANDRVGFDPTPSAQGKGLQLGRVVQSVDPRRS